ncbi:hypothetical protein ABZX40_33115 [Streptomyces sp. NPDC004610]|uniref:hypothetical protein n=1 Tax=unclassified Streptomyces TaxID=2593676 RepID=UPI0033BA7AB6
MTVFRCVNCQQPVTGDVIRREPLSGPESPPDGAVRPPRMAPGTFTAGSDGTLLILHPDDVPGTARHPEPGRSVGCCGPSGLDGPNLVCAGCGVELATRVSDCWTDNLVALMAAAVTEGRGADAGRDGRPPAPESS